MEYELRKLTSKDIYPVAKIISKIGFKEFKETFSSETVKEMNKQGENAENVGFAIAIDIVSIILGNLPNCEKEINLFLADITGLKVADIENLEMAEYAQLIIEIVKKEEFKDFFKVVSELLK